MRYLRTFQSALTLGFIASFAVGGCTKSAAPSTVAPAAAPGTELTGVAAMGDHTSDAPGVRRRITPADLPRPNATPSANNPSKLVQMPPDALPKAPSGF